MITFAENENRDIYVGTDNQVAMLSGRDAAAQASKAAIETQRGEVIYATNVGMPTASVVWNKSPNLQQFEFYARKQIMATPTVTEIVEFSAEIVGDGVEYQATIRTENGEAQIDGSV